MGIVYEDMCNICWYERRLEHEQYACFECRCVKNVCRKMPRAKNFYFAADGIPHSYITRRRIPKTSTGVPSCSSCSSKMQYVGPHFRAPKMKYKKEWERLAQYQWPALCQNSLRRIK